MKPIVARDIMVTRLVTLSADIDVYDAAGLLMKHRISGAPVVDKNQEYLGVFSEKCCMNALIDAAYDQLPGNQVRVFLDKDAHTITEDTDLLSIAEIFQKTPHRRLPVIRDGKLTGQVSRRDVIRAALDLIASAPDRETSILYLSALRDRDDSPLS